MRAELVARLGARRVEIERAILARVGQLSEPITDLDPVYIAGLQSAVREALSYGLECIEKGGEAHVPIPAETARQARRAAREGVRLDTVMRRYAAGNKLLEEFVVAEATDMPSQQLRQILSGQGPQVDRMLESVASEYRHELEQTDRSAVQRQADRVLQLLEDDSRAIPTELDYDFDAWHVGLILSGQRVDLASRLLTERSGCGSLCVTRDQETAWVWLASAHQPLIASLERFLLDSTPTEISMAVGEPRQGLEGWRLTHREARVALGVLLRRPKRLIRARDVLLLAGVMSDETLARSLLDTYLAPLEKQGTSGRILLETLRAYFSTGGNAAAAASYLGITRHTVQRRIRSVEQALGQLLPTCHAELQVALEIDELSNSQE